MKRTLYIKELALQYFHESSSDAARRRLKTWIERCSELDEKLKGADFKKHQHILTPLQYDLIIRYLGEP